MPETFPSLTLFLFLRFLLSKRTSSSTLLGLGCSNFHSYSTRAGLPLLMASGNYTPRNKSGKQSQKADPVPLSRDASWLSTLSEPELDFLISLKQLAVMRAQNAGHRDLANKFDAGMLRAIGVILLEHFKEKLKGIPGHTRDADLIDKLALLKLDTPVNVSLEKNSKLSVARLKKKLAHDGSSDDGAQSIKKQKVTVKEEPAEYESVI
ncbi:Gamma-tubulin complex component [Rhynchospora pubera]|uniref:Gamma-tubulin complex component n=1 Tax=Rhynchospora pubera TaxID=906938 RepID=A0AAV8F507_9POAL|nr:Gamma-tubulin complex component [Rhynchospora pubera]